MRRRRVRVGARLRRDSPGRRLVISGLAARGPAPRRASGHRRSHPRGGQAESAARSGRRFLEPRRRGQRQTRALVGPGRSGDSPVEIRKRAFRTREGGRNRGDAARRRGSRPARSLRLSRVRHGRDRRETAGGRHHRPRTRSRAARGCGGPSLAGCEKLAPSDGARAGRDCAGPPVQPARGGRGRVEDSGGRSAGPGPRREAAGTSGPRLVRAGDRVQAETGLQAARRDRALAARHHRLGLVLRWVTRGARFRRRSLLHARYGRRGRPGPDLHRDEPRAASHGQRSDSAADPFSRRPGKGKRGGGPGV